MEVTGVSPDLAGPVLPKGNVVAGKASVSEDIEQRGFADHEQ